MEYCTECGSKLVYLNGGGCGGFRSLRGCERCQSVFRQISGGEKKGPRDEVWMKLGITYAQYKKLEMAISKVPGNCWDFFNDLYF